MEALKRTSVRAANYGVVRNYLAAHSGPQCFTQRFDQALMSLEPKAPHAAATRPKDFGWLICSRCLKQRRVDVATERLFANHTWLHEAAMAERRRLHWDYPNLSALLTDWFLHAAPIDGVVTVEGVKRSWN